MNHFPSDGDLAPAIGTTPYSYVSTGQLPKLAFVDGNLEFYGMGGRNADQFSGAYLFDFAGFAEALVLGSLTYKLGPYVRSSVGEVIRIPWADGSASPDVDAQFWRQLVRVLHQEARDAGQTAAIGFCCMAGRGRTGTALAAVMIAAGHSVETAVTSLRARYSEEAVETPAQIKYLVSLDVLYNQRPEDRVCAVEGSNEIEWRKHAELQKRQPRDSLQHGSKRVAIREREYTEDYDGSAWGRRYDSAFDLDRSNAIEDDVDDDGFYLEPAVWPPEVGAKKHRAAGSDRFVAGNVRKAKVKGRARGKKGRR